MAKIINFREIKAWQKSHELVLSVYKLTDVFPRGEVFCLVSQMRRAAISIAANIVEGFRKCSTKDSLNFYNIANGSLEELRYYFILVKDLKYINEVDYQKIVKLAEEVSKILNGWIKSQKQYL